MDQFSLTSRQLWSEEPRGGRVRQDCRREASDRLTWLIIDEKTFVHLVGSVTTWVKLNLPARSLIGRKQGLVWGVADIRLMLKSPSRTVYLSLVGWMSERAVSKSSIIDTGADGGQ